MDLPQVDTCCFGLIPLKTGSMIVGIVTLVIEITLHGLAVHNTRDLLSTLYAILVICGIVSSILLIYGVYANNKLFVKFFLISFALLIIFAIIFLIWFLLRTSGGDRTTLIINTIVYVCVIAYCLIVVNSYYKTMA